MRTNSSFYVDSSYSDRCLPAELKGTKFGKSPSVYQRTVKDQAQNMYV